MSVFLGNLSVDQIEKEYQVKFSEEDKKFLIEHHESECDAVPGHPRWHFYDIPRMMECGTKEFLNEVYERMKKYSYKGQFQLGVHKNK